MPTTIAEIADRQRANGRTGTREYFVDGTTSIDDARTQLLADAPATWETGGKTLYLEDDDCEAYDASGRIYGVARYKAAEAATLDDNETAFSFDTTGGTTHIIRSRGTTSYGTSPPSTQSLIGVTKDSVEGVDIVSPLFSYQVTKRFPIASVTQAYIATIFNTTGTVNSATFTVTTDDGITFSFAAGENLFLGATGGVVGDQVEITFKFAASPNATGISVGGISSISKLGWQYLWVLWEDAVSQNTLVKQARAVYVETVYPTAAHGAALTP